MTTSILGMGGDDRQVLSYLWYAKQALLSPDSNLTLGYTNYIFYPNGIHISLLLSPFSQLLGIPLQLLFGLNATYNILWLLSFVLGGLGTYLLVKYLTGNAAAAFFAGMVFAFAPYHFVHALGHMGATAIEWIPFCALYLMKTIREDSLRNAVLAAVFFILVDMSDMQYMVFMGFFAGVVLLFEIVSIAYAAKASGGGRMINDIKRLFVKFFIFGFISLLVIVPLYYNMIAIATSGDNYLQPSSSDTIKYSADLLSFLVPSPLHPLAGDWLRENVYDHFTGNIAENTTFIGYTVLLLAIFAIVTMRNQKYVIFWAVSAVLFAVLSLGPVLHVFGNTDFFGMAIPLPYALLSYVVPFISNSRTPSRLDVLVMLSFATLAGYGMSRLLSIAGNEKRKYTIFIVITLLFVFEFISAPAISAVTHPAFYDAMGKDNDTYAVLEIPASTNYSCGLFSEYYQTISNKPMVGGQIARSPQDINDFEIDTPFIHQLTYLTNDSEDIFDQNVADIGSSVLRYYNIRYVIIHKDYLSGPQFQAATGLLNASPNMAPVESGDDNLTVYRVNNGTMQPFMVTEGDWWPVEVWGDNYTRWMKDGAALSIYSNSNGDHDLTFSTLAINNNTLQVFANGQEVYENRTNPWFTTITIPVQLKKGDNTILFKSLESSIRPADMPQLNSTDMKNISFAFQHVYLS